VRGELTVGQVYAFMSYGRFLAWMFHMLGDKFRQFSRIFLKASKVFKLLDRDCALPRTGNYSPEECKGIIELENVTYSYPTKLEDTALKNFSLKVESGQLVALVGESGCGKSTTIRLMNFLYGPNKEKDAGRVLLDGHPVSSYSAEAFKKFVVAVPQEPVLFARSLKDNISYGEDCTMEQIIEAAKSANAHDFIMKLDRGYDSVVGERGLTLSGGERQRISIARAFVRRPRVLLLDEATASLDSKSERLVHEAIDRLIEGSDNGMTVVIVAHRLSTVKNADRIIVMESGEIAETGNHHELMEKDGIYADFVRQQFLDTKPDEVSFELQFRSELEPRAFLARAMDFSLKIQESTLKTLMTRKNRWVRRMLILSKQGRTEKKQNKLRKTLMDYRLYRWCSEIHSIGIPRKLIKSKVSGDYPRNGTRACILPCPQLNF